jgi:hypothetical protein
MAGRSAPIRFGAAIWRMRPNAIPVFELSCSGAKVSLLALHVSESGRDDQRDSGPHQHLEADAGKRRCAVAQRPDVIDVHATGPQDHETRRKSLAPS